MKGRESLLEKRKQNLKSDASVTCRASLSLIQMETEQRRSLLSARCKQSKQRAAGLLKQEHVGENVPV